MPAIYKNGLLYAGTSGGSGANTDIIADEYTEKAYAVGDYCIHKDALYKCNTAITVAESWTAAHWTEKDIATELKAINNTISTLGTASTKNVPSSGDAGNTEVVLGNDTRLTDARPASDTTSTYSSTGTVPVNGTAVASAISGKMNTSNPTGTGSFSMNRKANTTVGTNSVAEGYSCTASGEHGSHAEGYHTTASGHYGSHAEGSSTTASGNGSHAEGGATIASGIESHAEGYSCTASGNYSHVEGYNCTAQKQSQHVFGEYNVLDTTGADGTVRGDYVEIVGNGTDTARSNARTLDWSGNEWIAGNYKSDALTASKLLVSDANKNIVSSSLAESDLITTSNIGSQSVNNATKWNGKTDDSSTANNTDTWIPVYASGKMQHTERVIPNSVTHTGYNANQGRLATLAFLSFWNGAYNANGGSNLQYCDRGRFGTIVTKGSGDYAAASHTHSYLPLSGGTMTGDIIINTAKRIAYGTQCSIQSLGSNNTICLCGNAYAQVRRQDNPNTNQGIYAAAFTVSSSKLIKENIKNLSEEEAKKLLNIRVVDFDYIEKVGGEKDQHGVIAEEVLDILPYVVSIPDNYNEDEEKQKIESDSDEIINVLGVDYAKFTPYLIKMVQMQQKQIDNLQQEINELKYGNHA